MIQAQLSGSGDIEIWGDGEQTRSFTYIDDCLEGTMRLMESTIAEPLNIGSEQLVGDFNDPATLGSGRAAAR